jgi:solute:Na+ symporter, SSS family
VALKPIDWMFVGGFFLLSLIIGLAAARRAGKSSSEYFLSGRNMPWWLLGVSMVATTFSSDTPNLVTDIVRQNGVAGNWVWWAFLLTGMLTVFIYAKLWRRSRVMTDIEFYELRYSGKAAAFLRGFRALYLGVFFNVLIMAAVSLAIIKIGGVMLKLTPVETLLIVSLVTVVYSTLGGLRGVLITDFFQFAIAMIGAVGAAVVALRMPQVGGIQGLLNADALQGKLAMLPDFSQTEALIPLFILPLAVQWWSVWYPGAEPGGGGYIAQRMLSAKTEKHAVGATLLFNAAHYALRPWPWIIVALCSVLVFPDLTSLKQAFPHVAPNVLRHDLAYPAMLTFLPAGLLGLVVASLIAAFMSTISTHLNWGSSYVVNDFYKRFLNPEASDKMQVRIGRISTVALMVLTALLALVLSNALQAFQILLQIGAGTGLLFILRWFWWRINPYSELTAMAVSFLAAVYLQLIHPGTGLPDISVHGRLLLGVSVTTVSWVGVTFITRPSDEKTLRSFYRLVKPGGPGWVKVVRSARAEGEMLEDKEKGWDVPAGILCMVLGSLMVYSALFSIGYWIYGKYAAALLLTATSAGSLIGLTRAWKRLRWLS